MALHTRLSTVVGDNSAAGGSQSRPAERPWASRPDLHHHRRQGRRGDEKINIPVPGGVLVKIDAYAKSRGISRSGFLVQAAQEAIAHGA